ncbi:MAG: hypothetical protein ACJATT_002985 [Myxococcota bacterium]
MSDGLADLLVDQLVPSHMISVDFHKKTKERLNSHSGGLQRAESLADGVGMASRMANAAGPGGKAAAVAELLATTEVAIGRMEAWRDKDLKSSCLKKMQPYLIDLTTIAVNFRMNDVRPSEVVVGQARGRAELDEDADG